jgi:signal transduction histidine kinase
LNNLLVTAVVLIQDALISGLLHQRRRRQFAEVQLRQRLVELTHSNRYSLAGELAANIAHEINQPLSAILANSETLELEAMLQSISWGTACRLSVCSWMRLRACSLYHSPHESMKVWFGPIATSVPCSTKCLVS